MCSVAANVWDSAQPLFLVRPPAVELVTLRVLGSPLATRRTLNHQGALCMQCHHKDRAAGSGGQIVQGCRERRPLLLHTCSVKLSPPWQQLLHETTTVPISCRLWIRRLSPGCRSLLLPGMIMRLHLPSRLADSLLLCVRVSFSTAQQKIR